MNEKDKHFNHRKDEDYDDIIFEHAILLNKETMDKLLNFFFSPVEVQTKNIRKIEKPIPFDKRLAQLKADIDACLDNGDKDKFMVLSAQYKIMMMEV